MNSLQSNIETLNRVITMAKVLAEQNGSDAWLAEIEQAYMALEEIKSSCVKTTNERI